MGWVAWISGVINQKGEQKMNYKCKLKDQNTLNNEVCMWKIKKKKYKKILIENL